MPQFKPQVVKLGGSLLDQPELPARFNAFRESDMSHQGVLLVGGGRAAEHVRQFDQQHTLGEEAGHWLAVRAMQLNCYMMAAVLRRTRVVTNADECAGAWAAGELALVDPLAWLDSEHRQGVTTPHRWSFTSDSIAAHIATRLHADRLVLLKSALPKGTPSLAQACEQGIIDGDFQVAAASLARVELVNLRAQPPSRCVLQAD